MNAAKYARALKRLRFPILGSQEGQEHEDGMVEITTLVQVQIPTYGSEVSVSADNGDGESFTCYPLRRAADLAAVAADIRTACGVTSHGEA